MHWTKKYQTELNDFMPLVEKIIKKSGDIPTNPCATHFITDIFIRLSRKFEKIFYVKQENPLIELKRSIEWLSQEIDKIREDFDNSQYRDYVRCGDTWTEQETGGNNKNDVSYDERIKKATGEHYGTIFTNFNLDQYEEALDFIKERLKKNDIEQSWFKGKIGLDAGCGSGRYVLAYKRLGAKKMVGIDCVKKM